MAKIDRTKEEIGRLKLLFGVLTVSYISFMVWIFQKPWAYESLMKKIMKDFPGSEGIGLAVWAIIPILIISLMIISIDREIVRKIKELEDL